MNNLRPMIRVRRTDRIKHERKRHLVSGVLKRVNEVIKKRWYDHVQRTGARKVAKIVFESELVKL